MMLRLTVLINVNEPKQLALADEKQTEQCCALVAEEHYQTKNLHCIADFSRNDNKKRVNRSNSREEKSLMEQSYPSLASIIHFYSFRPVIGGRTSVHVAVCIKSVSQAFQTP